MIIAIGLVIFGGGVAIGADIQDRMAEQQRRRAARRHRELNAITRQLQDQLDGAPARAYLLFR